MTFTEVKRKTIKNKCEFLMGRKFTFTFINKNI